MKSIFNKDNILYLVLAIMIIAYTTITWFIPTVNNFFDLDKKLAEKRPELSEIQRNAQMVKKEDKPTTTMPKKVFENTYKDANLDTASILTPVVDDVIIMVKNNGISVESVSFITDAIDASITSTVPQGCKVMEMDFSLKSSYSQLQNFLSGLYKYDYLVNIYSLRSYVTNSEYDTINTEMKLILYSK